MKEGILCWNWGWWEIARGIFIDALGDFLCTQAITTKECNSSSEIYQQNQTAARAL